MSRLTPRRSARATASVVVVTLLAVLTGCGLFPSAPEEMTTAVDEATNAIRQVDGVTGVSSDIFLWDIEHLQWRARIAVEARDAGVDLRDLVESVEQYSAISVLPTSAALTVPGEGGAADVRFIFSDIPSMGSPGNDEMADAALALRTVPGARSVSVADDSERATIVAESGSSLADTLRAVRSLAGFGAGALSTVDLTVEDHSYDVIFDEFSPPDNLAAFLDDVSRDPGVLELTFWRAGTGQEPAAWRPELGVEAASAADARIIAGLLTTVDDSIVSAAGVPRTSFTVSAPDSPTSPAIVGYLGLPLGSPEPNDLSTGTPGDPPVQYPDPAGAAARLHGDTAMIRALLDAAGDVAGIRGQAPVSTEPCSNGANQQVRGSVVIPVFEIADSADEAFAAVTAAWESQRFVRSDRAMGRDYYTSADDSLESLSIRGTTEGISILAVAPCVVSP